MQNLIICVTTQMLKTQSVKTWLYSQFPFKQRALIEVSSVLFYCISTFPSLLERKLLPFCFTTILKPIIEKHTQFLHQNSLPVSQLSWSNCPLKGKQSRERTLYVFQKLQRVPYSVS